MSLACILNLHVSLFPVVCQLEQLLSVMNVSKTGAYCIFFLQNIKKTNPGMSFTDVGRALGEKWKKMTGMLPSLVA